MIRRNIKHHGTIRTVQNIIYPPNATSQSEPSLKQILVMYSRGEDISPYLTTADKASANQQFMNRKYKEDFLSELYYDKLQNDKEIKTLQNKLKEEQKQLTIEVSQKEPPQKEPPQKEPSQN